MAGKTVEFSVDEMDEVDSYNVEEEVGAFR